MASHSRNDGVNIVRVASGSSKMYLASMLRFLRNKSYDVIQVDNRPHYMAAIKKARPRTKVTLFLHSLTFVPKTLYVKSSLKHADLIIANSGSLKSKLTDRFPAQAHKIRTAELGVEVKRFHPPSESERIAVSCLSQKVPCSIAIKAASICHKHIRRLYKDIRKRHYHEHVP